MRLKQLLLGTGKKETNRHRSKNAPLLKAKKKSRRRSSQARPKAFTRSASSPKKHQTTLVNNRKKQSSLLRKNRQRLSVIISASNEQKTIGPLIDVIAKLKPKEMIVVDNGSTAKTLDICLKKSATCYSYPYRFGHDIGRAIGAREATGDVLLFLDADIPFTFAQLIPFVIACYEGVDIALNNVNPLYKKRSMLDSVSLAKRFLNHILEKDELGHASLTAVPHAMTRKALETIGAEHLAIPPKAQVIAAFAGLNIKAVHPVDVFAMNKVRERNSNNSNLVEEMIIGDHVEAVQWVQAASGERGIYHDNIRQRHLIAEVLASIGKSQDDDNQTTTHHPS